MKQVAWVLLFLPTVAAAAPPPGSCEVTVEGAVTASGKSQGGVRDFGTDYWYTPEELEAAVKQMVGLTSKKEAEPAKVAEAMKKDPKITTFILNCMTPDVTLSFLPQGKYADVPFGPKKYAVHKGLGKTAGVALLGRVKGKMIRLTEDGVLDVTAFDKKHVAGTFELHAKQDAGDITIKGKFDYPCHLPTKVCAGAN
jgi:hypothetical protein